MTFAALEDGPPALCLPAQAGAARTKRLTSCAVHRNDLKAQCARIHNILLRRHPAHNEAKIVFTRWNELDSQEKEPTGRAEL